MTSKEALNSIADKYAIKEYDKYGNLIKWVGTIDKEYFTIMKDLEILEILKEKAILYVNDVNKAIKCIQINITTCDNNFDKVEEWLNEK